ncbi:MAG: DNA replication/repair protein RecF [Lachnospiraceae bacterium]|nr:DNA replication/repair protein RecF [Candidatus Equihabitans merdae]
MYVESMELFQFRNIEHLKIDLHPGTNLFWGDNAQGKTNILEAVYLCGTTRSHRGAKDRDMIRLGQDESHIRMIINKGGMDGRIDFHLKKHKTKGIAVNGQPIRRASDLLGLVSMVFFSPEDLNMIKNGPSERRRFIDRELSQLDKVYLADLAGYNKCLDQRNHMLHEVSFRPDRSMELEIWDTQLAAYGERVIDKRVRFIEEISPLVADIHSHLTGGKEKIELIYEPSAEPGHFLEKLERSRQSDIRQGTTTSGPQRDDLCVMINGMDARSFASQGQQRTAALSMKLSEIELVKKRIHDEPVLLLDDVLSELDESRQDYLLDSIRDTQTLITCTGIDDVTRSHFNIDRAYHISSGGIL